MGVGGVCGFSHKYLRFIQHIRNDKHFLCLPNMYRMIMM